MRMIRLLGLAMVATYGALFAIAGTSARYVNPLSIEQSRSVADPTVVRFHDKYYMFLSGGMVWVSDDLVSWRYEKAVMPADQRTPTAPNFFEYNGSVYLSGNSTGLYKASNPIGPWTYIGDLKDASGKTMRLFDQMTFVDSDGRVYMYYSGMHTSGIWGVELDRNDLTHFVGEPVHLFTFDPSHKWERYGDNNEGTHVSWLEAPWMTKHKGRYYLQYSSPGTEWKTYSVGVYTADHPLGPFTCAPRTRCWCITMA